VNHFADDELLPDDAWPVHVRMLSNPLHICMIRAMIERGCMAEGMADDQASRVMLSIDEALTNVIRHGYKGRYDRPIDIRFGTVKLGGRRAVAIVIDDESGPCDLDAIRPRSLDEIRPGGLGVHIIRETMDRAVWEQREGNVGLRLRITKFIDQSADADAERGKQ